MRRATFADAPASQGAAALNRVFQNYLVPMNFSPEQLHLHMTYNDVDAGASPVWSDEQGSVVAAGLLAIRGKRGWIGGFGVAPEYRGKGYARQLLTHMIDAGRERALETIALEVLQENTPAIGLYRSGGFEVVRELYSFEAELTEASMPDGYVQTTPEPFIEEPDEVPQCWQRQQATLRNGAVSTAVSDESGNFAAYRSNAQVAQILRIRANSSKKLTTIVHAVAAAQQIQRIMILNEPADSPIVRYATSAQWKRPFTQYEMLLHFR